MTLLVCGLILFLGVHSISIIARDFRNQMVERLGEAPWKGIYTLLALAGFALIVIGYGQARLDPVVIYTPPVWVKHAAFLLLLPVFPILLATYLPGRIRSTLKHPTLVATKLWALAHLLVNGTLADVLLFGGFLAWAVADRISVKRRNQPTPAPASFGKNDIIALVAGLVLYVAFVGFLHTWLIGVSPISR